MPFGKRVSATAVQPRKQARRGKSPGRSEGDSEYEEIESPSPNGFNTDASGKVDGSDADDSDYVEATGVAATSVEGSEVTGEPSVGHSTNNTSPSSPSAYFTAEDASSESLVEDETSLVVKVRLARCRMPYKWREPLPPLVSVLSQPNALLDTRGELGIDASTAAVLTRALSTDEVSDASWLSSSFIDLVLNRFARDYPECHFMPTEFAAFRLKTMQREDMLSATDILGRVIDYRRQKPVIFLANIANMHWNLIRVQHWPIKELQLFEPMGKPPARQSKHHGNGYGNGGNGSGSSSGGISMRYIPQHIVHWLDTCWPLRGHFARCARVRGLNATASALDGDEDDDDDIGGDGVEFVGSSLSLSSSSSSSSSRSTSSSSATTSSRGRSPAPLAAAAASGAPSSNSSANGRNGKNGSSKSNHGSNGSSNGNGNGGASSTPPLLSLSDDPLTWLRRTTSAITSQHQMNGFDCGVACLLYAEKCAQGMMREDVNATTDQAELTHFRVALRQRLREMDVDT